MGSTTKNSKIYVVVKEPGNPTGEIREVDNTLRAFQELVGGHIEAITMDEGLAVICNEDGRFLDLPHNCKFGGIDFVGTIAIVGVDGEDVADCPLGIDELDEWMEI